LYSNSSWVAKRRLAPLVVLIIGLVIALAGGAGTAPAASPVITLAKSSFPAPGVPVAYSNVVAGQSTYISYTIHVDYSVANGTLTHAALSDPVDPSNCLSACADAQFTGAEVVYVSPTCGTPVYRGTATFPKQGVTCQMGSLSPGAVFDVQIIFKVPTAGGLLNFTNTAGFTAKEGTNDNSPTSGHTDTFVSNTIVNPLVTDAKDALNSYAPPGVVTTLQTDPTRTTGNFQKSQVTLLGPPNVGSLVTLAECGGPSTLGAAACPTGTSSPCPTGTPCTTQTSLVFVTGSGPDNPFFQSNHMTLVFTLFASELSKTFNVKKLVWYHNGYPVGLCSNAITDPTGDCLVTAPVQDKSTGDVTITVDGPSQGGWGGIG
jgi:hypothetical protein